MISIKQEFNFEFSAIITLVGIKNIIMTNILRNNFILNLTFHWYTYHITKRTNENEKHLELYEKTIKNALLKIQK